MDRSVYPSKDLIKATHAVVAVYANKNTDHGSSEVVRGEEKVTTCKAQFGLACEAHVKVMQEIEGYFLKGQIRTPIHLLCKPDGSELSRKDGKLSVKDLIAFIGSGVKQVGKGLSRDDYFVVKGKLDQANAAIGQGDLKTAFAAADEARKHPSLKDHKAWQEKAEQALQYVNEAAMERVNQAQAAAEAGDAEGARQLLQQLIADCGNLSCVATAKEALAKIEGK